MQPQQLRLCVLRRPREPLACSETPNAMPGGKSVVDSSRQQLPEQPAQHGPPMHPGDGRERDKLFNLILQPKDQEYVLRIEPMCESVHAARFCRLYLMTSQGSVSDLIVVLAFVMVRAAV